MDPEFSLRYRELYERHWWFRAREDLILEILRRNEPNSGWGDILDVGCGDGLFFGQLQKFGRVEGVEPVAEVIHSQNPFRSQIHVCPFDENFRPGKKYSLILMLDVLEHLDSPVAAMRHALSLLEPGGSLLLTVPAFRLLWTSHDKLNDHRTRYTKFSFTEIAKKSGMTIERIRYLFFWLFFAKLAVRAKEGLFGSKPAIPKVPSAHMNGLLYLASQVEEKLLGSFPIPIGGSLLVLGHADPSAASTGRSEYLEIGEACNGPQNVEPQNVEPQNVEDVGALRRQFLMVK